MGGIRVKAVAIVRRPPASPGGDDEVLLSFAIDPDTGARYGRFLGGGIEAGETAADAVRRELREEIGLELQQLQRLGVVENLFSSGKRQIHEVIFVFAAAFADPVAYEYSAFPVREAVCDGPAVWVSLARLRDGEVAIYPRELLDVIP